MIMLLLPSAPPAPVLPVVVVVVAVIEPRPVAVPADDDFPSLLLAAAAAMAARRCINASPILFGSDMMLLALVHTEMKNGMI